MKRLRKKNLETKDKRYSTKRKIFRTIGNVAASEKKDTVSPQKINFLGSYLRRSSKVKSSSSLSSRVWRIWSFTLLIWSKGMNTALAVLRGNVNEDDENFGRKNETKNEKGPSHLWTQFIVSSQQLLIQQQHNKTVQKETERDREIIKKREEMLTRREE